MGLVRFLIKEAPDQFEPVFLQPTHGHQDDPQNSPRRRTPWSPVFVQNPAVSCSQSAVEKPMPCPSRLTNAMTNPCLRPDDPHLHRLAGCNRKSNTPRGRGNCCRVVPQPGKVKDFAVLPATQVVRGAGKTAASKVWLPADTPRPRAVSFSCRRAKLVGEGRARGN